MKAGSSDPAFVIYGDDMETFEIAIPGKKILLTNAERAGNRYGRATEVKAWRHDTLLTCNRSGAARDLPRCDVSCTVHYAVNKRGKIPDTGAWNPTLKAVIDGLVDYGCWPDDTLEWVRNITFTPAVKVLERDAPPQIVVTLTEVIEEE